MYTVLCDLQSCLLQGMCCAFIGPCLRDLQQQTNTTLRQISPLFVSHASGSMVGSLVTVYVVGGMKCPSIVPLSLVVLAASVAAVPWCSNLSLLLAMFAVQGLSSGLIATSKSYSVVLSLRSWLAQVHLVLLLVAWQFDAFVVLFEYLFMLL